MEPGNYRREFAARPPPFSVPSQLQFFNSIYKEIKVESSELQVFGYNRHVVYNMYDSYYSLRTFSKITSSQIATLRPFILESADLFPFIIPTLQGNLIDAHFVYLMQWIQGIYWMAADYPEIAEVLLYSKQAIEFHEHIDSLRSSGYDFANFECYYKCMETFREFPHLDWFNLAEKATHIQGVDIETSRRLHIERGDARMRRQYNNALPRPADQHPLSFSPIFNP